MKKSFFKPSFSTYLILPMVVILHSSCCDQRVLVLCDLVAKLFVSPDVFTVGQAAKTVLDVINQPSGQKCETTDIAQSASYLLDVLWLNKKNNKYESIGSKKYVGSSGIPSLESGQVVGLAQSLTYDTGGAYRLDYYLDDDKKVDERDNDNNYSQNGFSTRLGNEATIDKSAILNSIKKTNNYKSVYIYVEGPNSKNLNEIPKVTFGNGTVIEY